MTDFAPPRPPSNRPPSLAELSAGKLGAPGTTVSSGTKLFDPSKVKLGSQAPPAPRGLLTQVWDVIRGAPMGLVQLGGKAAQTVAAPLHYTYDMAFNRDDHDSVDGVGDFLNQYMPVVDLLADSAGETLGRIRHPSRYLDAIEEGRIVDAILNDVGNIALAGGAIAKGVGAAGSATTAASLRSTIQAGVADGTIGQTAAQAALRGAARVEQGSGIAGALSRSGNVAAAERLTGVGNVIRQGTRTLNTIADTPFPAVRWAGGKLGDIAAPAVERVVSARLERPYTIPRQGGRIPLSEVLRHSVVGTDLANSRVVSRLTPQGRDFQQNISADLVNRTLQAQMAVSEVGTAAEQLARDNDLPASRQDPTYLRLTSAAVLDTFGVLEQQLQGWTARYNAAADQVQRDAVFEDIYNEVTRLYADAPDSRVIPRPEVVRTILDERSGTLAPNERAFIAGMRPAVAKLYAQGEQMGVEGIGGRKITDEEMGSEVLSIEAQRQRAARERELAAVDRQMVGQRERAARDERLANVQRAVAEAFDDPPALKGITDRQRAAARQDVELARAQDALREERRSLRELQSRLRQEVRDGAADVDRRITEVERAVARVNELRTLEAAALARWREAQAATPPDTPPPGGPADPPPQPPTPDGGVPPVAPAARAVEPEPERLPPDRNNPSTWVDVGDDAVDIGGDVPITREAARRRRSTLLQKQYEQAVPIAQRTVVEETLQGALLTGYRLVPEWAHSERGARNVVSTPAMANLWTELNDAVRAAVLRGDDYMAEGLRVINEAPGLSIEARQLLAAQFEFFNEVMSGDGRDAFPPATQLDADTQLQLLRELVESFEGKPIEQVIAARPQPRMRAQSVFRRRNQPLKLPDTVEATEQLMEDLADRATTLGGQINQLQSEMQEFGPYADMLEQELAAIDALSDAEIRQRVTQEQDRIIADAAARRDELANQFSSTLMADPQGKWIDHLPSRQLVGRDKKGKLKYQLGWRKTTAQGQFKPAGGEWDFLSKLSDRDRKFLAKHQQPLSTTTSFGPDLLIDNYRNNARNNALPFDESMSDLDIMLQIVELARQHQALSALAQPNRPRTALRGDGAKFLRPFYGDSLDALFGDASARVSTFREALKERLINESTEGRFQSADYYRTTLPRLMRQYDQLVADLETLDYHQRRLQQRRGERLFADGFDPNTPTEVFGAWVDAAQATNEATQRIERNRRLAETQGLALPGRVAKREPLLSNDGTVPTELPPLQRTSSRYAGRFGDVRARRNPATAPSIAEAAAPLRLEQAQAPAAAAAAKASTALRKWIDGLTQSPDVIPLSIQRELQALSGAAINALKSQGRDSTVGSLRVGDVVETGVVVRAGNVRYWYAKDQGNKIDLPKWHDKPPQNKEVVERMGRSIDIAGFAGGMGGAVRELDSPLRVISIDDIASTPSMAEVAAPLRPEQPVAQGGAPRAPERPGAPKNPEIWSGVSRQVVLSELGIEVPKPWRDRTTVDQGSTLNPGIGLKMVDSFFDGLIPNRRNSTTYTKPLRTVDEIRDATGDQPPIVLIACGSKKVGSAARAADMYTSDVFKKNLAAARAITGGDDSRIRIISAKHGYLPLDQVIDPYDASFAQTGRTVNNRDFVVTPLQMRSQALDLPDGPAVVLGGKEYMGAVVSTIGNRAVIPTFAGAKGIGEHKQIAGSIAASAPRPVPSIAEVAAPLRPEQPAGAGTPPPPDTPPTQAAGGGDAPPPGPDVVAAQADYEATRGRRLEAQRNQRSVVGRLVTADKRARQRLSDANPATPRTVVYRDHGRVDPDTAIGEARADTVPSLAKLDQQEVSSRVQRAQQRVANAERNVEVKRRTATIARSFAELTDDEKTLYAKYRRPRDRSGNVRAASVAENINRRLGAVEERARVSAARLKQLEDRRTAVLREIADIPVTLSRPVQARIRDLVHGRSKTLSLNDQGLTGPIKPGDWIELPNGKWGRVVEANMEVVLDAQGRVVIDKATGEPQEQLASWEVDMGGGTREQVEPGGGWRWRSDKGGAVGTLRRQLRGLAPPVGTVRTIEVDTWKGIDPELAADMAASGMGDARYVTEVRGKGLIYDAIMDAAARSGVDPVRIAQNIEALPTDRARIVALGEAADEFGFTPEQIDQLNRSVDIDERMVVLDSAVASSHAEGTWIDLPLELGRLNEDLGWAPQEWHNARHKQMHRFVDARVRTLADDALSVQAMPARWRPVAIMARRQIKVMLDDAQRLSDEGLNARPLLAMAAEIATNMADLAALNIDPRYVIGGVPARMGQAVDSLRPRPLRSDYQRRTPYAPLDLEDMQATQLETMVQRHRNHTYAEAERRYGRSLSQIPELTDWLTTFVQDNNRYPSSNEFIDAAKQAGWVPLQRGRGLGATEAVDLAGQLDEDLRLASELHEQAIASGDTARIQRTRFQMEEVASRLERAKRVTPVELRNAWQAFDRARQDMERLAAQGADTDALAAAQTRLDNATMVLGEAEAAALPTLVPDAIATEMARDASLWDRGMLPGFKLLAKSNRFFKNQVLPLSFRWYLNNALGNVLMAAAFGGVGPRQLATMVGQLIKTTGVTGAGRRSQIRVEQALLSGALDVGTVRGARIQQSGLLESQRRGLGLDQWDQASDPRTRVGRGVRAVTDRGYGINEFMDNMYRSSVYLAKIENYIVKGARNKLDVATPEGVQRVAEAALRDTLKAMGDYTNMAPWQRKYLRQIFPWWSWIRHSTIAAMRLPVENPIRTLWLAQLSGLANEEGLSGEELAFFGGRWMLDDGRSIPLVSLSPLEDVTQNPIFNPPGLIRSIAPAIKIATVATTGLDLGRITQVSQPPDSIKRGVFGQQVADPLIYDPAALAGYAVGQFPMLRNLRDVLEQPSIRYGTGQPILDKQGAPKPSGRTRLGSLAAIFGIPTPETMTISEAQRRAAERVKLSQ